MIPALESTVEKPLTPVDYCAALEHCVSITEVQQFSAGAPLDVRQDDRFNKAVAKRLAAIKTKSI